MKILFTTNVGFVSTAIRWATGEAFSHVAIQVDRFVIHSNHKGLHIELEDTFFIKNKVIKSLERSAEFKNKELQDNERVFALLALHEFSSYDFGAVAFFGIALLCHKLGLHWFKSNLWQSSGAYMCVEWGTQLVEGKVDSLVTPEELYARLKVTNEWTDVNG